MFCPGDTRPFCSSPGDPGGSGTGLGGLGCRESVGPGGSGAQSSPRPLRGMDPHYLFIPLPHPPQVIDVQLGFHVLLSVEGYKRHLGWQGDCSQPEEKDLYASPSPKGQIAPGNSSVWKLALPHRPSQGTWSPLHRGRKCSRRVALLS